MRKRENYLEEGISALLPVYTEGVGDTTLLITLEGHQRVIHKKIKSVLKGIAASLSYDIVELRRKYREILGQKSKIPIPFKHDLVLMPVSVRHPLIQGDETFGYINYRLIEQVIREGKYCKVVLQNGIEIQLLQSYSTTQKNILNAQLVEKHFMQNNYKGIEKISSLQELSDELHCPATRGDIMVLYEHIKKVIEMLESNTK
ncbi:hypothetical protein JOD02_000021 [Caldicoprobacter guelmensis]|uniref:hypothetical protein n=1 Tax=Caldicoprobacter guelmensis TaxID=1170224 RepID=UPI00195CCAE0|nr:hypothetical protein [Caldicoprobacter guelmensis]MBM7581198.1 hypothetical protein [Caldicoprobacter guelmensis]